MAKKIVVTVQPGCTDRKEITSLSEKDAFISAIIDIVYRNLIQNKVRYIAIEMFDHVNERVVIDYNALKIIRILLNNDDSLKTFLDVLINQFFTKEE